ncbi:Protein of unknown function [Gryllus bimaculatus]|nr:Protein of unknown function [Gryllus bimaculatus]
MCGRSNVTHTLGQVFENRASRRTVVPVTSSRREKKGIKNDYYTCRSSDDSGMSDRNVQVMLRDAEWLSTVGAADSAPNFVWEPKQLAGSLTRNWAFGHGRPTKTTGAPKGATIEGDTDVFECNFAQMRHR